MCKKWIKRKTVICKYCHVIIDHGNKGIQFIETGFSKIENECKELERNISIKIGFAIRWHKYCSEDLIKHMDKIESIAGKIKDDLMNWGKANKISDEIKKLYNEKANNLYERLDLIQDLIYRRKPTGWEAFCDVFAQFFKVITEKLLPFISFKLIPKPVIAKALTPGI